VGPQIDDRLRHLTFERWRELARREPPLRAAARQWLIAAVVFSLRRAVKWRIRIKAKAEIRGGQPDADLAQVGPAERDPARPGNSVSPVSPCGEGSRIECEVP